MHVKPRFCTILTASFLEKVGEIALSVAFRICLYWGIHKFGALNKLSVFRLLSLPVACNSDCNIVDNMLLFMSAF